MGLPSVCAVIAVRDERPYLQHLLPQLREEDIEVVLLDHGSTDGSRELAASALGQPVRAIVELPATEHFSLADQLRKKAEIIRDLPHDWVIHQDADEMLHHRDEGGTLRGAFAQAEAEGHNAVNFEEFVFLPEGGGDLPAENFATSRTYYFHEPRRDRLLRAWRRDAGFSNLATGGHTLAGPGLSVSPQSHVLRHYIVLNQAHARRKYGTRLYDPKELAQGWHTKKARLRPEQLVIPATGPWLFTLETPGSRDFRRDRPARRHFWEW